MKIIRFLLLAALIIGALIIIRVVVRDKSYDGLKQLQKARAALQLINRAREKIAEAEAFYQAAMADYEKTLPEGEHKRGVKYLFIDLKHIQEMDGVKQVFHQPVKERLPVVIPDRRWEQARVNIWSPPVWSEEKALWQMWYIGGDELLPLYAESKDGIRWEKPALGLIEWNGSSENNIINLGFPASGKENRIVLIHDDDTSDTTGQFKALTRVKGNLIALVSADGWNWEFLKGDSIPSGDEYRLCYDRVNHRYIAMAKLSTGEHYSKAPGAKPLSEFGRRIRISVSEDFVNWTDPELMLWGDEEDQELGKQRIREVLGDPDRRKPQVVNPAEFYTDIYNMPVFAYEDLYLGLPTIFNQSGIYTGNMDGIYYPSLAASRDLYHWDRLSRQPFIPLSPLSDKNNFDYGLISTISPVRNGNELWFYYTGSSFTHLKPDMIEGLLKSPDEAHRAIFLARLRMDGFVSIYAGEQEVPGTVLTRPVKVTGPNLYLNVDASKGELFTEIRDAATGKAINDYALIDELNRSACLPVCKNAISVPVRWQRKKDVSELLGREVIIHFSLNNAHLYAFWFDD